LGVDGVEFGAIAAAEGSRNMARTVTTKPIGTECGRGR
jgi:hypothetical protein